MIEPLLRLEGVLVKLLQKLVELNRPKKIILLVLADA